MRGQTDLAAWLLEQVAEDERIAREATPGPWMPLDSGVVSYDDPDDESGQGVWPVDVNQSNRDRQDRAHIAHWDPRRVLAECETRRRIIEKARAAIQQSDLAPDKDVDLAGGRVHGYATAFEVVLYVLAQPYADREGFREEWRRTEVGR